jgi:hypothetical protein
MVLGHRMQEPQLVVVGLLCLGLRQPALSLVLKPWTLLEFGLQALPEVEG